jgi:lipopolysaccharide biosynthesis glycosyltransferase
MLKIFIGFDPNETVAYHTLCHSIITRASKPVSITPLILSQLPMTRIRDPRQSTEFAFSRFLVPYLCNYEGRAIFMDCDMLCLTDISLMDAYDMRGKSVMVVKHDYKPKTVTKFLGQVQTRYEKKNWSSVMMFNNRYCRKLTPEYVNKASGLELHQFHWTDENMIGELPKVWNHLVGEYEPDPNACIVHYTLGGPYFKDYENCEYSVEWFEEFEASSYSNNEKQIA